MRWRMVVSLIALALLAGMAEAQSLGEVARQQRGDGKKAKRVITDDDLPARSPSPEAAPAEKSGAPSGGASKEGGETAEAAQNKGQETPGKGRDKETQAALKRIDELKESETTEKRIIEKFEKSLAESPSEFRRQLIADSLRDAKRQLENFSRERQQLEQKVAAGGQAKAPQAAAK